MATADTDRKETLLATLQQRAQSMKTHDLAPFVSRYFRAGALDELLQRRADDLFSQASNHWRLATQYSGAPLVRLYNPRMDEDGWESRHTVMQAVTADAPFLVDSITAALNEAGLAIHFALYPLCAPEIIGPTAAARPAGPLLLLHFEVDRRSDEAYLQQLGRRLHAVIEDVLLVNTDWSAMRKRLKQARAQLDNLPADEHRDEAKRFLNWLHDNHFTFLGFREYELATADGEDLLKAVDGSDLGAMRRTASGTPSETFSLLPAQVRAQFREPSPMILTKSPVRSTVHRAVHMDCVGVKRFDADGQVTGELRFLGLYTAGFYHRDPNDVPIVRGKIRAVMERTRLLPDSHDGKALQNILATFPRDELLQIDTSTLHQAAIEILNLNQRQRTKVFLRQEPFSRFVSCLVYMPRDRFSTDIRRQIQSFLMATFEAESCDLRVSLSESSFAQVYLMVHTPRGHIIGADTAELEQRIGDYARIWRDDLRDALFEYYGEELGSERHARYRNAFKAGYREDFDARTAVRDIERAEQVFANGELSLALYRSIEDGDSQSHLRLMTRNEGLMLSDVLPVLENMGVRVISEKPYKIRRENPDGAVDRVHLHLFVLRHDGGYDLDSDSVRQQFETAFRRIWDQNAENDGFNRLVLTAGLDWRQIVVLRAIAKYLKQIGLPFSQPYVASMLVEYAPLAVKLVELFEARFDPQARTQATVRIAMLSRELREALDEVDSLDADRTLRAYLSLTQQAIVRTNHYQRDAAGQPKPYLSFKLDPAEIPDLPEPRPKYEIFVYAPRVEGVHLRGGKVARGGLRWSDRPEDFRTEILGLVKAQMVKNAIIVPVGSKGGFVCKQLPGEPEARWREVQACYQDFIRGLLDLTDNLADDQITPPPDSVRHDVDDPYLVVAADKGTATFSDQANAIARDYAFWLDDAFASGGRHGYDHKKMGITARGAWVSVQRHFREQGVDIQTQDITVVGVGDMSGDVFGNGMLLSEHIRLIAAFDHRHIFIDPNPDAAASYAERQRLFALPRSSWADYNPALISEGGGVFPRNAKSIPLSRPARDALGATQQAYAPSDLIRILLKAPVDLFWNGGIGTYVRAAAETNADVGDRLNDGVRITANQLRAKVIGEGGNLGLTQHARIEYSLNGGRCNTDAIDNAGGVNCSDHEVNIKILLGAVLADGDMTEKQRNALLQSMTDDVAERVLQENYWQTHAISFMEQDAPRLLDEHWQFIQAQQAAGKLDPALECLPNKADIERRKAAGRGLTRPELSVILGYARMEVYEALLESDVPEDPFLSRELIRYFPRELRQRYRDKMLTHRLRREIIATFVSNRLCNRLGATFVFRISRELNVDVADVARAYIAAWEVFSLREIWSAIAELDNQVASRIQLQAIQQITHLIFRSTGWLLRHRARPLDIEATMREFTPCSETLLGNLDSMFTQAQAQRLHDRQTPYLETAMGPELIQRIALLEPLYTVFDIHSVADESGIDTLTAGRIYFGLEAHLHLNALSDRITQINVKDRWAERARAALVEDLDGLHRSLTRDAATHADADGAIEAWLQTHQQPIQRYQTLVAEIETGEDMDLARAAVVLRELRRLAA